MSGLMSPVWRQGMCRALLIAVLFDLSLVGMSQAAEPWKSFEDSVFVIKYPSTWVIQENETDRDGYYYSFKDNSRTMGGLGVYVLLQSRLLGTVKDSLSTDEYRRALAFLGAPRAVRVSDIKAGHVSGRRFSAMQQVSGRPAEWRFDVFGHKNKIYMAFGFYRPDNAKQKALVNEAIDTFAYGETVTDDVE